MLFTSPWADIALAVLSAGQCPGEAARAIQAPFTTICAAATHETLCQPALSEGGSLAV